MAGIVTSVVDAIIIYILTYEEKLINKKKQNNDTYKRGYIFFDYECMILLLKKYVQSLEI